MVGETATAADGMVALVSTGPVARRAHRLSRWKRTPSAGCKPLHGGSVDLAARGPRQIRSYHPEPRAFEGTQRVLHVPSQRFGAPRHRVLQHDDGSHALSPHLVRDPDDARLRNARRLHQYVFDFDR